MTLPRAAANTFKAVMLLAANATTADVLAKYTQQKQDLSGVVVLLPDGTTLTAADASGLLQLEEQLLAGPTVVPVFLAPATKDLSDAVLSTAAMFAKGSPPNQHLDRFQLLIQGSSPSKVVAKQAVTYVASLKATDDQFKPGVPVAPTLLVTAHYDSFSIAPAAPAGADSSSSGAAACLLLLRMLHRLYASPESRPSRNVVVVLTAGGPYGQEGLRQWIADVDPAQLEAFEAAVAHSQAAAAVFGHQHLAKKGIPAVTLSSLSFSPATQLGGRVRVSSLGDVAAGVNIDSVLAAAQVEPSGTGLHDSLRQFMRAHSQGAVKRHVWSTAGTPAELTAWSGTTATLKVHKAAGALLDMVLTAGVLLYLVGLWVALRMYWHGWSDVTALFSPKPVRRSRGGGYKKN
eukprot:gene4240-4490_t